MTASSADTDLQEWSAQTVALTQAFLGGVSASSRMITLGYSDQGWTVEVVLEREDALDREEIEDAATQFEAFQRGPIELSLDVTVNRGTLSIPDAPTRAIFRRRENRQVTSGD